MNPFHEAGVIHMDLHPYNFMWKNKEGNEIDLKVIDWDAAHFQDEQLTDHVRNHIEKSSKFLPHSNHNHANRVYDVYFFNVISESQDDIRCN